MPAGPETVEMARSYAELSTLSSSTRRQDNRQKKNPLPGAQVTGITEELRKTNNATTP